MPETCFLSDVYAADMTNIIADRGVDTERLEGAREYEEMGGDSVGGTVTRYKIFNRNSFGKQECWKGP